ncbi:2S sulfur-rich seed storage protein 2-like [Dorcoceras hygrometricum]|uniref:2S sulfur-rich seed storage protein 2-like n=1 Tax=Dorcoceras hygrometricum TaxID=472368 RepID=A0A2Z7D4W0_9LAMI|nr:2S sulfur-rich seed storage protein 2-like [Dorcoceras hygrometricum]
MVSLFLSTVTLLVLVATTTATIRTVEIDNPGESRRCGQMIESQPLSSCRQYLKHSSRFEPGRGGSSWREEFPRCCDELERIKDQCRCEAVQKVAGEQEETGEFQEREMQELMQTARSLPRLCRISPEYCDVGKFNV